MRNLLAIGVFLAAAAQALAAGNYIWIEGESATDTNMKPNAWYAGSVAKSKLSGAAFISNYGPEEGLATYDFNAQTPGDYTLWIRANPMGQPQLDYKLNARDWIPVDFKNFVDLVNVAADGKPDLRFIAWIKVGTVSIDAGANRIAFRFHSANNNHGSLDCFVFVRGPFTPSGYTKPGERLGSDEAGWWAFEPGPESFGGNALLDLRYLNEARAGESGFVRADGDSFRLGDGTPVRFWGVNTPVPTDNVSKEEMDLLAARLAKLGVNMVRIDGPLLDAHSSDPARLDPVMLDNLFYLVNALKKQGIYSALSNYFVLSFPINSRYGIPGTEDIAGKTPFGLLIFEPRMQEIYKSWQLQILDTRSPYSGMTLAQDPALGLVEIQNEDSLFFWTFKPADLGKGPRELLETKFGAWLAARYGSIDKAFAAWPGDRHPDDDASKSQAGLYDASVMSAAALRRQPADRQKRILDQVRFLAGLQHDFYVDMSKFMRKELGVRSPISASNWKTAPGLEFLERYTYSGVDVIDKHGYFASRHVGEGAAWSVRPGQTYEDATSLFHPESEPFQYMRLPGHPHIQSEIAWNKPNRFIAEAEPLIAAYASLQGIDGIFLFVAHSGYWAANDDSNWPYMLPGEIGQSPAEAIEYRRGDLLPGDTVIREVVSLDDVLDLKKSGIAEGRNGDFRATAQPDPEGEDRGAGIDPLAYFVGRVERTLEPNAQPLATDLAKYIDRAGKKIVSSTGQIVWSYGNGLLTVNSPRSRCVAGFLAKAGAVSLGELTIDSRNEYGAIHVISLDGKPLETSRRILVQAFTEEKREGFRSANGVIQDTGHAPMLVRDVDARITMSNGGNLKAMSLDEQGYARKPIPVQVSAGSATVTLPDDALYTILTR